MFTMKWQTASFGIGTREVEAKLRKNSLEWTLSKLSFLDNHTKGPILLFVYSSEMRKPSKSSKKSPIKPTAQKVRSDKVMATVFNDDSFKMQICSRFFTCYWMDVSSVTEKESKVLCGAKAPIIAVFTHDGKLVSTHRSGLTSVFGGMTRAAKVYGVNLPAAYSDAMGQVRALYANELKLYKLQDALKDVQAKARPSAKGKKVPEIRKKNVEKAAKLVSDCQELSGKIKEKYKEILIKHTKKKSEAASL